MTIKLPAPIARYLDAANSADAEAVAACFTADAHVLDESRDHHGADAIRDYAKGHRAVLLANHGPVVAGTSLSAASASIEELEETAKLHLLLQGFRVRLLSDAQVRDVEEAFPS